MSIALEVAARNAAADAVMALVDAGAGAGKIKIRTGAKPASGGASTGTVLAVLTFSDPATGAAASGVDTASAITQDASADATGTAGHFEVTDSNDNVVFRGDVSASGGGGDMQLVTTSIVAGQPVQITSFTYTQPAGS
jgi:hypothetical protein